jgi:hypothetical protein
MPSPPRMQLSDLSGVHGGVHRIFSSVLANDPARRFVTDVPKLPALWHSLAVENHPRAAGAKMNEDEVADLAAELLKEMIHIGDASSGGPNASRLRNPYARGYVFGFVYALIQESHIASEANGLDAMTAVHIEIFGPVLGPAFLDQALSDEAPDTVFTQGQIAGARDILRCLSDRATLPLALMDYLHDERTP